MDLFTPLLMSFCTGTVGNYNIACQKSIQASYQQSGLSSQASTFQNQVESYGKNREHYIFGDDEWLINGAVGAVIVTKNKKASFQLPTFGICNKFSTDLQSDKATLKWEWKW